MSDDLYLLASEAPGALDGCILPAMERDRACVTLGRSAWSPGCYNVVLTNAPRNAGSVPPNVLTLDLALPEVRDRLVRWLKEHRPPSGLRVEPNGNATLTLSRPAPDALRDSPAALLAEVRAVAATMKGAT